MQPHNVKVRKFRRVEPAWKQDRREANRNKWQQSQDVTTRNKRINPVTSYQGE